MGKRKAATQLNRPPQYMVIEALGKKKFVEALEAWHDQGWRLGHFSTAMEAGMVVYSAVLRPADPAG